MNFSLSLIAVKNVVVVASKNGLTGVNGLVVSMAPKLAIAPACSLRSRAVVTTKNHATVASI